MVCDKQPCLKKQIIEDYRPVTKKNHPLPWAFTDSESFEGALNWLRLGFDPNICFSQKLQNVSVFLVY